jgi:hypothetical protein
MVPLAEPAPPVGRRRHGNRLSTVERVPGAATSAVWAAPGGPTARNARHFDGAWSQWIDARRDEQVGRVGQLEDEFVVGHRPLERIRSWQSSPA